MNTFGRLVQYKRRRAKIENKIKSVLHTLIDKTRAKMENKDLPSQLKVSKYAEARIKEIKALTQVLGES